MSGDRAPQPVVHDGTLDHAHVTLLDRVAASRRHPIARLRPGVWVAPRRRRQGRRESHARVRDRRFRGRPRCRRRRRLEQRHREAGGAACGDGLVEHRPGRPADAGEDPRAGAAHPDQRRSRRRASAPARRRRGEPAAAAIACGRDPGRVPRDHDGSAPHAGRERPREPVALLDDERHAREEAAQVGGVGRRAQEAGPGVDRCGRPPGRRSGTPRRAGRRAQARAAARAASSPSRAAGPWRRSAPSCAASPSDRRAAPTLT